MNQTAIVIGATGLVGRQLVHLLIGDADFSRIVVLGRRSGGWNSAKVEEHLVNFDQPESFQEYVKGDVLFSCLGTTLKQAGSKDAQYRVDVTYQLAVAEAAANNGVPAYGLISAPGANTRSLIFYSRLKGIVEAAVVDLSFSRIDILRPSVLVGEREISRQGEEQAAVWGDRLGKFIPWLRKYRSITGKEVARALIAAYKREGSPRVQPYTFDEIFTLLSPLA